MPSQHHVLAHEYLASHPRAPLKLAIIVTAAALIASALADCGSVWLLLRQRFTDDLGNPTASPFIVASISGMTLALYTLASHAWQRQQRTIGWCFYLGAIFVLLWAVADWAAPFNESLWQHIRPNAGNLLLTDGGSPAPGWLSIVMDAALAFAFSACGLLFIRFERRLAGLLEEWRHQHMASAKIEQERNAAASENELARLTQSLTHLETHRAAILEHLQRRALDAELETVSARHAALLAKARDVRTSEADRTAHEAEAERLAQRLNGMPEENTGYDTPPPTPQKPPAASPRFNGKGKSAITGALGLLLALPFLTPRPAAADISADTCAKAPVLQLLLDVSGSSPLTHKEYLAAAVPRVTERIRALPLCSTLLIVTVGDARVIPSMPRLKVLARASPGKGAPAEELATAVRGLLLSMPERIAKNPNGKSELVAAFTDAARNLNAEAAQPNAILMLSDGIEDSSFGDCQKRCRLPPPQFVLRNTTVALWGVGLGLPGERAMKLSKEWKYFFAQAGTEADLRRVF